jgi:hypothetical protein
LEHLPKHKELLQKALTDGKARPGKSEQKPGYLYFNIQGCRIKLSERLFFAISKEDQSIILNDYIDLKRFLDSVIVNDVAPLSETESSKLKHLHPIMKHLGYTKNVWQKSHILNQISQKMSMNNMIRIKNYIGNSLSKSKNATNLSRAVGASPVVLALEMWSANADGAGAGAGAGVGPNVGASRVALALESGGAGAGAGARLNNALGLSANNRRLATTVRNTHTLGLSGTYYDSHNAYVPGKPKGRHRRRVTRKKSA